MKKWLLVLSALVVTTCVALALIAASDTTTAVAGTAQQKHVELIMPVGPKGGATPLVGPIPPNGSGWHELYPAFCATSVQDDYEDNGDGVVSACDRIKLSGVLYHIVWAGPTYWTTCSPTPGGPGTTVIFEPTNPTTGENPICEIWHEVYPEFCRQIHIDSWIDNGDGHLTVCDVVDVQDPTGLPPNYYHIDRIECDITIEEVIVPVAPSTWSKIKSAIGSIF
ncbi:MAG: hypothetical protein FD129_1783 [bacterium]|nr:MAG: hypothetical protein FD129_1783 [bacterium]